MKRFLSIMLVFAFMFILTGCNDSTSSLANNLSQSVEKVKNVLNQTKEVSNEDLVFEEILSLSDLNSAKNTENTNRIKNINKVDTKTTTNISNKTKVKTLTFPKLKRQIVKNEVENKLNINTNKAQEISDVIPTRLTAKRASNASRLTSSYYIPRRVSTVNYNNSSFNNYLGQLEDIYLMMNDAVCANDNISSCKNGILECCDLLSILSQNLKNKEIELSEDQSNSCNSLLNELGSCTNKVTSSRNDVSNECTGLKQTSSNGNFKIDQISSKYVKLINCLDNRVSYYENILSVLKQLQCVLTGDCYQSTTNDTLNNLNNNQTTPETSNEVQPVKNNINNSKISNKKNTASFPEIFKRIKKEKEPTKIKNDQTSQTKKDNSQVVNNETNNNKVNPNITNLPFKTEDNSVNNISNKTSIDKNENNTILKNVNDTTVKNETNSNKTIDSKNAKIADFKDANDTNHSNEKKLNIDTYKEQTIQPNIIKNNINDKTQSNESKDTDNKNLTNQNTNQNTVNNSNNNTTTTINPNPAVNPAVPVSPNGLAPNVNTYGNGYYYSGVPGYTGNAVGSPIGTGVGTGVGLPYGNGVGAGVGLPGVGAGIGTGVGLSGVGAGVGTGVGFPGIGAGYNGIHNYENGVINPFRNTDTYKLNIAQPLPSETRKNFKPFTEIKSTETNLDTKKVNYLVPTDLQTKVENNIETKIKSFKVS